MRLASVQPGDIVEADVRGRRFHAIVLGRPARTELAVDPITAGISYRRVTSRQVLQHWRRSRASVAARHESYDTTEALSA